MAELLPHPPAGPPEQVADWVDLHLGDLALEGRGGIRPSPRFRGTQEAADAALAALEVRGYAGRRNQVLPSTARGATQLSPWIRHGLLDLPTVDAHVKASGAPARDVTKLRDELAWQEFSRHLYARLGAALGEEDLRAAPPPPAGGAGERFPWPVDMACMASNVAELEGEGWLVNQARLWLASMWTVRAGAPWRDGEDRFFTHLLDGSRAANRAGWQWAVGTATGRPYGVSRWQVRKRAPELCERCPLSRSCPIEAFPPDAPVRWRDRDQVDGRLLADPDPGATAGPATVARWGDEREPEAVWLTAESLGDADPALLGRPDLPAVFVFDEPLLARLRLSGKRLVFLAEALGSLAARRSAGVEVWRGEPGDALAGRPVAATFAPVPGFRRRLRDGAPDVTELHPWPWLRRPAGGPVTSFSAWRKTRRG